MSGTLDLSDRWPRNSFITPSEYTVLARNFLLTGRRFVRKLAPMRPTKPILYTGALWEVFRFAALYTLYAASPSLTTLAAGYLGLLWFGAPQLSLSAAFFFAAWRPSRYWSFLRLIIVAKVLSLFVGVLAVPAVAAGSSIPALLLQPMLNPQVSFGFLVLGIDFLFTVFLVSLRHDPEE